MYGDGTNVPDYFAKSQSATTWTQPILSSNGTLGGNSFAVSASAESGGAAWKAFDGIKGTSDNWAAGSATATQWLIFYNPSSLKVNKITLYNSHNNASATSGKVYGSNDNSSWTELCTWTNNNLTAYSSWDINVESNNFYNYYKIEFLTGNWSDQVGWFGFNEIEIDALLSAEQTAEEWWQSQVNQYGVCGKFVYDSVNNTVRLPKITGFVEGASGVANLGDLTEAGLPDHTHTYLPCRQGPGQYYSYGSPGPTDFSSAQTELASVSNSIYGNSNTVQPQSVKVLYYIVIATSTKTDIQVDIDEIATDLNGKADVDLTNVNNTGTSKVAGWAMPSVTYENLILGASGSTYTAPANGWFAFHYRVSNTSGFITAINTSAADIATTCRPQANENLLYINIPAKKNDAISIYYANGSSNTSSNMFRFIYAEGSESEA